MKTITCIFETILFMAPLIAGIATECFSGELLRDATIVEVASNNGNPTLTIRLSGGIGVCATGGRVEFPEAKAPSPTSHQQAIATALLAFAMVKKVRVHNFQDNSCIGANFMSITN